MIPVAFFAPLKSPDHSTPSGDRELARALMKALRLAGFAPDLASGLRCLDMTGNADAQTALKAQADALIPELITAGKTVGWQLWVSYHNYYKAPDLLGPAVADALGIPYVQIESTRARKRLGGPWDQFAKHAEAAADAAHVIFYFTRRDREALEAYAPTGQSHMHLRPFLPRADLPVQTTRTGGILTAAMMRHGDKLESFALIAQTLSRVQGDWHLEIAGDGPARHDVEALLAQFGDRVTFLGLCDGAQMEAAYARATLLLWPGVNEAIGLTYLEAQAAGVPVLAQDRPGLRDVLAPGLTYPDPDGGPDALARVLSQHLTNPPASAPLRDHVQRHHLLPAAAATLQAALTPLCKGTTP